MNQLLEVILRYNRANPKSFIEEVLMPFLDELGLDYDVDAHYNVYIVNGESPKDLYIAHADTCDSEDTPMFKELEVVSSIVALPSNTEHKCLGADDGAGVYILMKLLEAGIEGHYLFTTGEERGLIGMSYWVSQSHNIDTLVGVENCYEFDRQGTEELIVFQSGKLMADLHWAFKLSEELGAYGLDMYPSSKGVYTDNFLLEGIVPNVVNIAVGYSQQHSKYESLDTRHVENLLRAWISMKPEHGAYDYCYDYIDYDKPDFSW